MTMKIGVLPPVPTSNVFGLPLSRLSFAETMARLELMIEIPDPAFFVTAPLHYAMLTRQSPRLQAVNAQAAFLVADGMPLVWVSRWKRAPIAERVAGSDLVPAICELAARRGVGVFLLGAAPGVADRAAMKLQTRFPTIRIAGTACPKMSALTRDEEDTLISRIRDSGAKFLLFARGQPDGELWLAEHYERLGCISVQVGASLDFVANGVIRAPRWMQKTGTEWLFRWLQEPRRLGPRYIANGLFFLTHAPVDVLAARRSASLPS